VRKMAEFLNGTAGGKQNYQYALKGWERASNP
jgi:hypothetical protein